MFLTTNHIHEHARVTAVVGGPTQAQLRALFSKQPAEHLPSGQSLFFEGDDATHVFEILEGTLRVFRIISDGRRVITGFLGAGDIVGVSLTGDYLYSAEAITAMKVRRLRRKAFLAAAAGSEELRPRLLAHVRDEMADGQDHMVLLSCKSAEQRLCAFLLKRWRRAMAEGTREAIVDLPMTRQDMADHLGLTIETVSRTITRLTGKGVLECAGRHAIRIAKPATLAQLAGDGDEYAGNWRNSDVHGERRRH